MGVTSQMIRHAILVISVLLLHVHAATRTVLVTGATGRTGSKVYLKLQAQGVHVKALIRNATRAREVLHCNACNASEGFYVGDITQPDTLREAMAHTDSLVITTGPAYHCTIPKLYIGCKYYAGADPKTISWLGVKNRWPAFSTRLGLCLGHNDM